MKLVGPAECEALLGCPSGCVPPLGHPPHIEVLVDVRLQPHAGRAAAAGMDALNPTQDAGPASAGAGADEACNSCAASGRPAAVTASQLSAAAPANALYCGAGVPDALVVLTPSQLLHVSAGKLADIAQEEGHAGGTAAGAAAAPNSAVTPQATADLHAGLAGAAAGVVPSCDPGARPFATGQVGLRKSC